MCEGQGSECKPPHDGAFSDRLQGIETRAYHVLIKISAAIQRFQQALLPQMKPTLSRQTMAGSELIVALRLCFFECPAILCKEPLLEEWQRSSSNESIIDRYLAKGAWQAETEPTEEEHV